MLSSVHEAAGHTGEVRPSGLTFSRKRARTHTHTHTHNTHTHAHTHTHTTRAQVNQLLEVGDRAAGSGKYAAMTKWAAQLAAIQGTVCNKLS